MYRFKSLSTFLSHRNYSLRSLFTVCISSQLQLEVTIHSFYLITTTVISPYSQFLFASQLQLEVTIHSFYLIGPTVWSYCSHCLSHQTYSLKSLFTVFISPDLKFEVTIHIVLSHQTYNLKSMFTYFISSQFCQWLVAGRCFTPVTPVSYGRHDISEILLKVALHTINKHIVLFYMFLIDVGTVLR